MGINITNTTPELQDSSLLIYCDVNGGTKYRGGAIWLDSASITRISNCNFSNCSAFQGGAIYCYLSSCILEHLTIENNIAVDGGGICIVDCDPELKNCVINNNDADGAGGGIALSNSYSNLSDCIISSNYSYGSGGGIFIMDGNPSVINCTIDYNQGGHGGDYTGGGIKIMQSSSARIVNCIIDNNKTEEFGGGISSFSSFQLINSLITNNRSFTTYGGGLHVLSLSSSSVSVNITNCTFSQNHAVKGSAIANYKSVTNLNNTIIWDGTTTSPDSRIYLNSIGILDPILKADYCLIQGGEDEIETLGNVSILWYSHNLTDDPYFIDLANNDYQLGHLSPCIEAGTPDTSGFMLPELDLAGNTRIANDIIDMGCLEYPYPVSIEHEGLNNKYETLIYPNPAQNLINIDLSSISEQTDILIKVTNMHGEMVKLVERKLSNIIQIDVSNFPPGLYVSTISFDQYYITEKFILVNSSH